MSNRSWVCFACRLAVRRPQDVAGDVPCPECADACTYLGYKIPVPKQRDARTWAALRRQLAAEQAARAAAATKERVRLGHALEQEIRRLDAMAANAGRKTAITRLRRELAALRQTTAKE